MAKKTVRAPALSVVKEESEWSWPKPYRSKEEARQYAAERVSRDYSEAGLVIEALDLLARKRARSYADNDRHYSLDAIKACETLRARYYEAKSALSDFQGSFEPVSKHSWRKWRDLSPEERQRVLAEIGPATETKE